MPSHLREEIVKIIDRSCPVIMVGDIDLAAKRVLKYLDNCLGLEDDGWFDNDEKMLEFLE
jgi:hypothetical protein